MKSRVAVGLLLLVPFALFYPALFQGRLINGYDILALQQPFWRETQRSLAAHQWPLWMPSLFCGMPGIASCNLFFAYPSALCGALTQASLRATLAWDTALQTALSGLGMFLFLRRLGRSVPAALLGALFFQVSGSQLSQLNGGYQNFVEGIAMAPWAFWAADKGRREGSWLAWGLCGLAFSLQILAGAAQLFTYTATAVACFSLAPGPGPRPGPKAALAGLGLALGLAFLLAAPQLWPTLQYLPLAVRNGYSQAEFCAGSISLREALAWLVPGYFGWQEPTYDGPLSACFTTEYLGLLPWALAAAGLAGLWAREQRVRWMAGLGLAALFLAQRDWTPFYWLFRHLPVLRGFRLWSRILFLAAFAASGLAAFGWDALQDPARKARAWKGALSFTGLALAAAALALAWAGHRPPSDRSLLHGLAAGTEPSTALVTGALARASALRTLALLPLALALLWSLTHRSTARLALGLALAFHAADQGPALARFIRFVAAEPPFLQGRVVGPPPPAAKAEPYRVADVGLGSNRLMLMGYEGLGGCESMPMRSQQGLAAAMQRRFKVWLDLCNVRYGVLRPDQGLDGMRFALNRGAYPRAWLVGKVRTVADDEAAYALLADPGFDPRREVALAADPGLPGNGAKGSVTWLERSPASESLAVDTERDAVLVLSNSWYPSWRCRVDGVDGPVLKADGGLQAVALKAGRHRLDFRFDPALFTAALWAAAAGLALLLALGLREARTARGFWRFF